MRLHHFIFYLYIFLALHLVPSAILAQPLGDNTPPTPEELSTDITPEWLVKQQQVIVKAQAALGKERQTWKTEEKNFPKKQERRLLK